MYLRHRIISIWTALLLVLLLCACESAAVPPGPDNTLKGSVATATPGPVSTPTPTPTPEPTPSPEPTPVYTGPDLAEQPKADDTFFADTAFFGNSLVDGLQRFGLLDCGDFFAETSASVISVGKTLSTKTSDGEDATLLEALTEKQYGKIYILLGVNEIGFNVDSFTELYGQLLDRIREAEPEAELYIMSLTPITRTRSKEPDIFTRERVEAFNAALYDLAKDRQCYYVDLFNGLSDEEGWLPEEESTDGIHLAFEKYPDWTVYLKTHYSTDNLDGRDPTAVIFTPPED